MSETITTVYEDGLLRPLLPLPLSPGTTVKIQILNTVNVGYQRRDEIIFGRPLTEEDYRPKDGHKYFEALSVGKLGQLLEEGCVNPNAGVNYCPRIWEFYSFGKKWIERGYNAAFSGCVHSVISRPNCPDYVRTQIEEIEVTGSSFDKDFVSEFKSFAYGAQQRIIKPQQLAAWWD